MNLFPLQGHICLKIRGKGSHWEGVNSRACVFSEQRQTTKCAYSRSPKVWQWQQSLLLWHSEREVLVKIKMLIRACWASQLFPAAAKAAGCLKQLYNILAPSLYWRVPSRVISKWSEIKPSGCCTKIRITTINSRGPGSPRRGSNIMERLRSQTEWLSNLSSSFPCVGLNDFWKMGTLIYPALIRIKWTNTCVLEIYYCIMNYYKM